MNARSTAWLLAVAATALAALVAWRGVALVADGDPVAVLIGLGVIAVVAVAAGLVWREVGFGLATQRLGKELAADGGLPPDDLPRRPSGRAERAAADEAFAARRDDLAAAPDDWRGWYRLAIAYDDAGDRRRAREAMRHAIGLHQRPVT